MEINLTKVIAAAILFVGMVISGVVLTRMGHPLNKPVFAIHKIVSLAAIAITIWLIWPVIKQSGWSSKITLFAVLTLSLFFVSLVSGAFLSFEKTMPAIVTILHRVSALLVLISGTITGWLLVK